MNIIFPKSWPDIGFLKGSLIIDGLQKLAYLSVKVKNNCEMATTADIMVQVSFDQSEKTKHEIAPAWNTTIPKLAPGQTGLNPTSGGEKQVFIGYPEFRNAKIRVSWDCEAGLSGMDIDYGNHFKNANLVK